MSGRICGQHNGHLDVYCVRPAGHEPPHIGCDDRIGCSWSVQWSEDVIAATAPEEPSGNDHEAPPPKKVMTYADIKALTSGFHRCGWNIGPVKNPNPECGCMCGTVYNEKGEAIISYLPRHSGVQCKCFPARQPEPHPASAGPDKQEKRPVQRWRAMENESGEFWLERSGSGEWVKHDDYAALRAENARLEKALAGLRESHEALANALKYPRYGTTADLLRNAAKALDHYAAEEGEDTRSFITPHMKRAANGIDAALANAAKLGGR